MIAEGGTEYGHMETLARSKSPWGPFEPCPHNPILTHRDQTSHSVQGTGHADLIEAHDGSWWLVFLAFRPHDRLYLITWGVKHSWHQLPGHWMAGPLFP